MRWSKKIKACFLVIVSPAKFLQQQKEMASILGVTTASDDTSAQKVHEAFWISLWLVLGSGIVGGAVAEATAGYINGVVSPHVISGLQVAGALLLLWGTLFVRGWEIQTFKGSTLIEQVNQWIYRFLYFFGTALFVASLVLIQRQP